MNISIETKSNDKDTSSTIHGSEQQQSIILIGLLELKIQLPAEFITH